MLLSEFEIILEKIPKNKRAEFTVILFIILLLFYDENDNYDELIKHTVDKDYMKNLIGGIKKFLGGKSPKFKYDVNLLLSNAGGNEYKFVSRYMDRGIEYYYDMIGVMNIFRFLYFENQERFWKLLNEDKKNIFFISTLFFMRLPLTISQLKPFLNSDDPLRANAVFYFINSGLPQEELVADVEAELSAIFQSVGNIRKANLLVNYLFVENKVLKLWIDEFKSLNVELILSEFFDKDLNNLFTLIQLEKVLRIRNEKEFRKLFLDNFITWVIEDSNTSVWDSCIGSVRYIIDLMTKEEKLVLQEKISKNLSTLLISEFDQEIRFVKYLSDQRVEKVTREVLEML